MKTIPVALQNILNAGLAYLTYIIEIDSKTLGTKRLTTARQTITISANEYKPFSGVLTSNFVTSSNLAGQDIELILVQDENGIKLEDILALEYDNQEVRVYIVDQKNPAVGSIYVFNGKIKEHSVGNEGYITLSVISSIGDETYIGGETYSPTCRNQFGDSNCGIDMDTVKTSFTVTAVTNNGSFQTDLTDVDDFYKNGLVQLTSGNNSSIAVEVKTYANTNGEINTWLRFPKLVEVGNTGFIWRGCNKSLTDCKVYNNIERFRGEPYEPPRNTGVGNTANQPNYYTGGVTGDGNITTIFF